jgi:hypothetical protein
MPPWGPDLENKSILLEYLRQVVVVKGLEMEINVKFSAEQRWSIKQV